MSTTERILSISELTYAIKNQLESQFSFVTVKGEISNFKEQSSGHLYFTLKDSECQVSAVLFKGNNRGLARLPKAGDQVIAKGEISVYPPRGSYQLIIRSLEFAGVGELLIKFQELKEKLKNRGLFDAAHKKALPKTPKTIGVVTSPTGSVIQDILHVLTRRYSGFHLLLNPVRVQGDQAAKEIAQAINDFNRYNLADLLIVGRGGGSLEDLWPFNEEIVVEAVYNSQIPIISAVGHETDVTLCDYAADLRAPTPSAAAELAVAEKSQLIERLALTKTRFIQGLRSLHATTKAHLQSYWRQPLFSSPHQLLRGYQQQLDEIEEDINREIAASLSQKKQTLQTIQKQLAAVNPIQVITGWKEKFSSMNLQLQRAIAQHLEKRKEQLSNLALHLQSIDPKNLLQKGYAILHSERTSELISSVKQIQPSEKAIATLSDGKLFVTVERSLEKSRQT